jgi:hypothetical protein
MGFPTPGEGDFPKPGHCDFPDFPDDYCYVEGIPGESGGSEPGYEGSGEDPGRLEDEYPVEDIPYPPGHEIDDPGYGVEEPGYEHPGDLVCVYDLAPVAQEKGKGKARAEARKRAQARKKAAAAKRAQARRQAARKRAAAKRERLKAKKAAQGRNR